MNGHQSNEPPPLPEPPEEPGVSWTIIGVIIIVFLCFTIIPAMIFFMDR